MKPIIAALLVVWLSWPAYGQEDIEFPFLDLALKKTTYCTDQLIAHARNDEDLLAIVVALHTNATSLSNSVRSEEFTARLFLSLLEKHVNRMEAP